MVAVVCELYGDYDARTGVDEIFLRGKTAEDGGEYDYYDVGGDDNDVADNVILFWASVVNLGSGEFADFADFALCDGVGVFGWCSGGGAVD